MWKAKALLDDAFFLKRANALGANSHRDLLAVDHKGLFLQVWLKDTVCATQREAHIVAELFAFSG